MRLRASLVIAVFMGAGANAFGIIIERLDRTEVYADPSGKTPELRELLIKAAGQLPAQDLEMSNLRNRRLERLNEEGGTEPKLEELKLRRCDFSRSYLQRSSLAKADLRRSNFTGAYLTRSDLRASVLDSCILSGAHLNYCQLDDSTLQNVQAERAFVKHAQLNRADLSSSVFRRSWFIGSHFVKATLTDADLSNAILAESDLTEATLVRTHLAGADLENVVLDKAVFEPATLPSAYAISQVKSGLKTLKVLPGPEPHLQPLIELARQLEQEGFTESYREVSCAIERNRGEPNSWYRRVRLVLFDWTCEYGASTYGPLKIIGVNLLVFCVIYFLSLQFLGQEKNVWVIKESQQEPGQQFGQPLLEADSRWRSFCPPLRPLYVAVYLCIQNAFRLKIKDFSIHSWIVMLQPSNSTLDLQGTLKVFAGIQSLLSFYLLTLWVVCLFGPLF